ncbi:hypothetical protein [Kibdelosporangium aridum]|uniref:hypothetical protein n=1 Tax=Kibdelosporangium aridum TaxID=2030 RepID=UPI000524042B
MACWRTAVVIAAVIIAGCGTTSTVGTTNGDDASGDFFLPVDAYALTVQDSVLIGHARDLLVDDCMSRLGVETDLASRSAPKADREAENFGHYGNRRRYGITNADIAKAYGYHLVGQATEKLDTRQLSPAVSCIREADAILAGPAGLGEAELVGKISRDSYQSSMTDPSVTQAFTAWSECMKAKGYHHANPIEVVASFDIDNPVVSPLELATAETDIACKHQTHLIEIWHGIEARHQSAEISKHASQLETIKARHKEVVGRATQVIHK